jgi:hypothetical protein
MQLQLSHFEAAALFAFFTSVVFAVTTKNTRRERLIYFGWCFAAFLAVVLALGWLMHFAHG